MDIKNFNTITEQDLLAIIEALKSLDLSDKDVSRTYNNIKPILSRLGNIIISGVTISPQRFIARSRCCAEKFYNRQSEISYVQDVENIKDFNRASPPKVNMFYGAIQSKNIKDFNGLEAVCLIETSNIKTDKTSPSYSDKRIEYEYVTTGLWEVIEPLELAAIVHYDEYCNENSEVLDLRKSLEGMIGIVSEHVNKKVLIDILEFIASEFAKPVSPTERYNYMISSGFSEMVLNFGLDGILYPSQKGKGGGFNVALRKEVVDNKLRLTYAMASQFCFQGNTVHPKRMLKSELIEDDMIRWTEFPARNQTDNLHFKHIFK